VSKGSKPLFSIGFETFGVVFWVVYRLNHRPSVGCVYIVPPPPLYARMSWGGTVGNMTRLKMKNPRGGCSVPYPSLTFGGAQGCYAILPLGIGGCARIL
jgi:hypothetical protein